MLRGRKLPKYTEARVKTLLKRESEVWIYSYADLVTNLLAFFILLLVVKSASPEVVAQVRESLAKATQGPVIQSGDISNEEFANVISQYIQSEKLPRGTSVTKSVDGVSLVFSGGVFFESASADLSPEAKRVLSQIVPLIKKLPKNFRIDVAGHSDSRRLADDLTYPTNWELSSTRASSVVKYFEENGIRSQRMRAIGYSDTRPISKDLNLNRRVVIRIGKNLPD